MDSPSRVAAFFRGFGFDGAQAMSLAARFGEGDDALCQARDAATAWVSKASGPWAGESPAGFAAARAAFVRARIAERFPTAFLSDDVPAELRSELSLARPLSLPSLMPMAMHPQDVRMLPVIDDVLRSLLPLSPKRS